VISVAAVDSDGVIANFSQRNNAVELSAPGVDVLSTVPWRDQNVLAADGDAWSGNHVHGAPRTTLEGVTGEVADGGTCTTDSPLWGNKIVLCQRGQNMNYEKVANVARAHGAAAVTYNNVQYGCGSFYAWSNDEGIPAISLSCAQAQAALANQHVETANLISHIEHDTSGYEAWSGTSMATPHVSGVAALVWSHNPSWSNAIIRQALQSSAINLGNKNSYGFGLVQAKAALAVLAGDGGGEEEPPPEPPPEPGTLSLFANVYKLKGVTHVDLAWAGATSAYVDIFRDTTIATVANTGVYTDNTGLRGGGSLTYRVCEANTSTCSGDVAVNY
jgi:serine protease